MKIRKVNIQDLEKLKEIGQLTFAETFSSDNSEENMRKYLEEGFSDEKLKKELMHKSSEFYFAELDDKAIGYLKVNYGQSQTEIKDEQAVEIDRKSTRLNSSHVKISYAVFCLKKKKKKNNENNDR